MKMQKLINMIDDKIYDPAYNYYYTGKNLANTHENVKALEAFLKGLSYAPDNPHLYTVIGELFNSQGNSESAFACFNRARDNMSANDPQNAISTALHYNNIKQYDKAIEILKTALRDFRSWWRITVCYFLQKFFAIGNQIYEISVGYG